MVRGVAVSLSGRLWGLCPHAFYFVGATAPPLCSAAYGTDRDRKHMQLLVHVITRQTLDFAINIVASQKSGQALA